ncbi:MAG: efflux RND transporter periplasmic adaptor subunit [Acidobacteria bacterium]|nr:efflux RND transporter periplasmic adaptor subunit [Acidobacteriota bacterium]
MLRAVPLLLLLAGCSGPYSNTPVAAKETAAADVSVIRVTPTSIPEVVNANGELFAEESATLSTKVPGRIVKLNVDLGSLVKAGEIVAELEKTDYEFRAQQAAALVDQSRARLGILGNSTDDVKPEEVAVVKEADAALREARFILETTRKLEKDGVVSRIDFEKANVRTQGIEARYQAALAEVSQTRALLSERRAQLALARQQLDDTVIRAPFTGAVTRRQASQGEFLPVNAPLITLVQQSPLRVRLSVPERQAMKIRQGQTIEILLEGNAQRFHGRVVRISPAIEAQNRSLTVEGEIPNPGGVLRPGSFVEGLITVNSGAMGIAAPADAIAGFAGIDRVYVVTGGTLDDRVVKRGRQLDNNQIEILEGLSDGDQLVAKATDRLAKGQKVRVR